MSPLEVERVLAIAAEAAAADGVEHLDEAARLELEHRPESVGGVVNENGFAIVSAGVLALVVRPAARGFERSHALLARIREFAPCSGWSHGDHPAAAALAAASGWRRDREVLRLTRTDDVEARSGAVARPREQTVAHTRSYLPGDAGEILRVNAAAFDDHPEQGAMTLEGLGERMSAPWFAPEDLLLSWDGDTLLGLCWIKRVSGQIDEIYLFGVDPAAQGSGVGGALLRTALDSTGSAQVYTDADNAEARRLYERAGFRVAEVHAHYARP